MERNPFVLNFGKVPRQYISRELIIDEIVQEMNDEESQNNCFMLTGTRGSGKTVTMTEIEQRILESEDWIVVRLNAERNLLESLVGKLYDSRSFITQFVDANLNLSKFGIGLSVSSKSPVADIESALEKMLKEIQRKEKKLLVSVDEVSNTASMRELASCFQILIRENYPVFLLMAGLYDNISDLRNAKTMTFLYRTPQYEMEPLNLTLIADRYSKLFGIDREKAMDMAVITKGYPFAYQAMGKYVWEEEKHELTETVLIKFDEALRHYVYKKMWSELSDKDKWYMSYIVQKDEMPVAELLEITKQKKNEFSQYRERLRDKGIIDVSERGVIKLKLPRFDTFVKNEIGL
ncbi:ATP-binding protein [Butyrivibrio sp. DSM 10294]|uniref:ATP-binding protein n=1 Tax=Butyrivibrio sp. DSM 10294 TaxID=2972457 RepID=UPI00234EA9AD|nr:ATP-binding protein [Butyrivibrio sp. DSM 10294]MDC7294229.1 ATP-binding protein [Butyrivibrio sp. DSM 10294]